MAPWQKKDGEEPKEPTKLEVLDARVEEFARVGKHSEAAVLADALAFLRGDDEEGDE